MCLSPTVVAERCDRLEALLHALRVVTVSREEAGTDDSYSASLFLIHEVEIGLTSLAAELKHCTGEPADIKPASGVNDER